MPKANTRDRSGLTRSNSNVAIYGAMPDSQDGSSTEYGGQDETRNSVRGSGNGGGHHSKSGSGSGWCYGSNGLGSGQACPRGHSDASAPWRFRRQGNPGVVAGGADRPEKLATHYPPQRVTPDRSAGRLDDLRAGAARGLSPALLPYRALRRLGSGRGRGLAAKPSATGDD